MNDINLVVNYDFPLAKGDTGMEQYVHRVGRTGRAGRLGRAVSFFEPTADGDNAAFLLRMMGAAEGIPEELVRFLRNAAGPDDILRHFTRVSLG